jgi:hypothetical protein
MKDDATPATKADLQQLEARFTGSMDERFARVHEDIDRIINILVNVQQTLSSGEMSHEKRITRLERHVGLLR